MDMERQKIDTKKSLRFDLILIASLLIISALAIGVMLLLREEGGYVTVEIAGDKVGEYPLYLNGEYELNGGTNILVIENGEAYMSYADCPGHVCIKRGRIKYRGQSIECSPNNLIVKVKGNADSGVDFVS